MSTFIIAIDPSLSSFAIASGRTADDLAERTVKTKPTESSPSARVNRYREIVRVVDEIRRGQGSTLVLIEGYSFGNANRAQAGHHDRAELRGVLYDRLTEYGMTILEVAPATLKKFATGKGNADKAAVVSALAARYGRMFRSNDEADAYALYQVALAVVSEPDERSVATKQQREAIDVVRAAYAAEVGGAT